MTDANLPTDCRRCRELMDLRLLGLLHPEQAQALDAHLAQCAACRREARVGVELAAILSTTLGPQSGDDVLAAQVAARAVQAVPARTRRPRFRVLGLAAAAACVLLGGTAVLWLAARAPRARDGVAAAAERTYSWRVAGVRSCRGVGAAYPLVSGRVLLAFEGATTAKRLLAVDRESGQCLWRTPFEVTGCALTADASRGFTWRPGAGGGQDLVAVDLAGGHVAWERTAHDLGRMAAGVSLVVAGDALCWTVGSHVAAVDAARGTPRWHTSLDRAGTLSVPATDGTAVFVASAAGVWALAADSGHALWHVADSGSRFQPAPPAVYCDGQALVVATGRFTGRGNLRCHDPATGAVRWHRDVAAPLHSLTLAGDVFVRCGRVRAFSGATGAPLWSAPLDGCGPVVLSQRRLYTTEGQGHAALVALDARNGMRVWQRHLADSCSGLVVIDRMGFLASNDGSLYALNVGWSG